METNCKPKASAKRQKTLNVFTALVFFCPLAAGAVVTFFGVYPYSVASLLPKLLSQFGTSKTLGDEKKNSIVFGQPPIITEPISFLPSEPTEYKYENEYEENDDFYNKEKPNAGTHQVLNMSTPNLRSTPRPSMSLSHVPTVSNSKQRLSKQLGAIFPGDHSRVDLVFSLPKSGTTALEWIVQSIFDHFKEEYNSQHSQDGKNDRASTGQKSTSRRHNFYLNGKHLIAAFGMKHREKFSPLLVNEHSVVGRMIRDKIPAWSNEALLRIPGASRYISADSNKLTLNVHMPSDEVPPPEDQKYMVIFRNPIATAVSNVFYHRGKNLTDEELAETVSFHNQRNCIREAAIVAMRYRIVTEILPKLGFQIYPLFFDEMRTEPARFIHRVSEILGLQVNSNIVRNVMEETSPEHMKRVQDSQHEDINHYQGLATKGTNSRKVRNAELKGYEHELPKNVLQECVDAARFHLPKVLRERFDI